MITSESIESFRGSLRMVANRGSASAPYLMAILDMLGQISDETTNPEVIWSRLKDAIKTSGAEMTMLERARAQQPMSDILRFMHTYEEEQ